MAPKYNRSNSNSNRHNSLFADNGVDTNGAAAKAMNVDRLCKKVRPGTFGNIKVGKQEHPKSPSVKKTEICSDPVSADPICPFPIPPKVDTLQRGVQWRGVQWIGVVSYSKLVYNVI